MQLYFTLLLLFFSNLLFCQLEQKYDLSSKNLPYWVTLMYNEKSDVGNVIQEYEKFYRENEFKKKKYTQYYKRWLRDLSRSTKVDLTADKKVIYQIIFESNDKLRNFKLVNL